MIGEGSLPAISLCLVTHLSFVATCSSGPQNSDDINFSLCNRVCLGICPAPLKSQLVIGNLSAILARIQTEPGLFIGTVIHVFR